MCLEVQNVGGSIALVELGGKLEYENIDLSGLANFTTLHCKARQVGRGDETCVESPKFQIWKLSIGKSHKLRG